MKKIIKRAGILFLVFMAAVVIYFVWQHSGKKAEDDSALYTTMDEPGLPIVYVSMYGKYMNALHGFRQDMGSSVASEVVTILPEDRQLKLSVEKYAGSFSAIEYEIRNMDLDRLIEKTEITDWKAGTDGIELVLPIQNLIVKETEYILCITFTTERYGPINYYTRVLWTDNNNIQPMIALAEDFSSKTYDYNEAKELTAYLETNETEDNTSLGMVTLRSSFNQLTWNGLKMQPIGEVQATLKELDGIMGHIELDYMVSRDTENGETELYQVKDNFTMKWNEQRIYMMDYTRETNQVFLGGADVYSGKRLMAGISNDHAISTFKSPNNSKIAYIVNRDLWVYDQKEQTGINLFSFRSGKDDGVRSNYDRNNIKVLSVDDTGDIEFLVYGYMNRGEHEGMMGISLYRYSNSDMSLTELLFIPAACSFSELDISLRTLSYKGEHGMLYIMFDNSVYGIDLKSYEYIVIAQGLNSGAFSVSPSMKRLAWQTENDKAASGKISIMNLDTGLSSEISAPDGEILKPLGFVGFDFVYGTARPDDIWIQNGRMIDYVLYKIDIIDDDLNIAKSYEKDSVYLTDVSVEESRIHLKQLQKTGNNSFIHGEEDTIVCNIESENGFLKGIGWYASLNKEKLYFIQLDTEIKSNTEVKIRTPKKIVYSKTENLELNSNKESMSMYFYAYANGDLAAITDNFSQAALIAYNGMGYVTDVSHRIIWDRVNRPVSAGTRDLISKADMMLNADLKTGQNLIKADTLILDARGCRLSQVLYYVACQAPVIAYTDSNGGYLIIYAYDQYNISVFNPITSEYSKLGMSDAATYFESSGNDFVCALPGYNMH